MEIFDGARAVAREPMGPNATNGKEMLLIHSANESIDLYQSLLDDKELGSKIGTAVRKRVIKHAARHSARQMQENLRRMHRMWAISSILPW